MCSRAQLAVGERAEAIALAQTLGQWEIEPGLHEPPHVAIDGRPRRRQAVEQPERAAAHDQHNEAHRVRHLQDTI